MKGDGIVQGGIIIFDKNGKARYAYREGKYSVHVLSLFILPYHIDVHVLLLIFHTQIR